MQIKFITAGANSAFGGFSVGDVLRCSPAMAKHLVDDLKCAVYLDAPSAERAPDELPKQKHKARNQQ